MVNHAVAHLNIRVLVAAEDGTEYAGSVQKFGDYQGLSSAFIVLDASGAKGWFLTSELKPETHD